MTRREAEKRAAELARKIERHQHAYFIEAKPLVSDREYDGLFDELAAIEREFPDLAREDSPIRRVGSDLTQELPEAAHTIPVLSLDKAYALPELSSWIEKTARNAGGALSFVCEEKIDVIDYKDVRLVAQFVSERGKILPRRLTGTCSMHQREVTTAIKRARNIALLPFASEI